MKTTISINSLLAATFIFICVLISCRIIYAGNLQHVFLTWNIFLAWIPYVISNYFKLYQSKQKWKQVILFCSWLLFFPNALYIITDLIHIKETDNAPVWFDAILIFTSSLLGLLMAFISLFNTERYLSHLFRRSTVTYIMPLIIFIGSFGVYLGRFQRWNSWDVLHSPLALGQDILACFVSPEDHFRSWGITFMLSILFYLIYGFSKILPQAFHQNKNAG